MNEANISQALKTYRTAARAAKAFQVAHAVALGCAAASLAVGGLRTVKRLRERK